MKKKRRLQVGMEVDIMIFEQELIRDRVTYEDPDQTSANIVYAPVGSVLVVDCGEVKRRLHLGNTIKSKPWGNRTLLSGHDGIHDNHPVFLTYS